MGADVAAARVEPREWMAKAAWARRAAPWALVSCGLSLATYTTTGYQYQVWPQFFLQYVLRYSGRLSNDWATQFPSPHWAVSHGLAWVPGSWLASVVFVLWALGLIGLWLAFAAVCRLLGLTWPGVIGAGLVAVSTGFAGLGLSRPVTGFLYPTNLSFVFIVLAVVALLEERAVLLGLALGLAILLHPDMGVLGALAILPAYLLTGPIRAYRRHAALAVALLVPASPALYEALANLVLKSSLSSHRRYELLAEVRAPWHFLYRAFPAAEWAMVGGWLVVFVVAVRLLPQDRSRRALTIVVVASGVVCALGAAASQWGQPLFLVQLQTARLTSLMILVAIVVAFSALHSAVGRWTGVIGAMVFLVAPVFQTALLGIHHLPGRIASALSPSSLEAGTLFVLVLAFAWAARSAPAVVGRSRPATAALACSLAAVAITLIPAFQTEWDATPSQTQKDWVAVATKARAVSRPRDLFLVPPDEDLFALWSYRPVVVTFGSYEFGQGDSEWVRRISIVTGGDPRALSPTYTTNVIARGELMDADYDQTIATSRKPICSFGAKFVVVSSTVTPPTWLERVYETSTYDLYRVAPGTCTRA